MARATAGFRLRRACMPSIMLVLLAAIFVQPSNAVPNVQSEAHASTPSSKDDPVLSPAPDRSTRDAPPAPGSKNALDPPTVDPNATTRFIPDVVQADDTNAVEPTNISAQGTGWLFTACGSAGNGRWTSNSLSFQAIRSCTLTVPQDGYAFISASGSVRLAGRGFAAEGRFRVGVDDPNGDSTSDRWVNVYGDNEDGTDKTISTALLAPVRAGAHTFYFIGAVASVFGGVELLDPSLSVLYVPQSSTDVRVCGAANGNDWTTTANNFQMIRSCTLNAPQNGYAFISASASAHLPPGSSEYEGRFRLGVDSLAGDPRSDRWVNVYPDGNDGSDESVATSMLAQVTAGQHTFSFLGYRYNGSGTVQLLDPTISVIYFPAANVTAKVCGASATDPWTSTSGNFQPIVSCSLNVARNGFALIDATASAGLNADGVENQWEGRFRLNVDSNDTPSDRFLNIYADVGDGTDKSLALSVLTTVSRGSRTFSLVGRREDGPGTLRLYSPTITVIVPGASYFMPIVRR